MKKKRFCLAIIILLFAHSNCIAQQVITLATLLKEMTTTNAVATFPSPAYTLHQASSYDRRSVAPDKPGWFANTDQAQFIRTEIKDGCKEYVMLDADGPGVIVRFWLTTGQKAGKMRFYFDNETNASVEIPAFDLMKAGFKLGPGLLQPHSSYDSISRGGNTLYLPIPYQKHCKITWEDPDTPNIKQPRYYQINYRRYTTGTKVSSFSKELLITERNLIDATEHSLWHPENDQSKKRIAINKTIEAGREISIALPKGSFTVRSILLNLQSSQKDKQAQLLRSTVLKIVFDGAETVWCPVGDFSGNGVGGKTIKSWYREVDNGKIISRWIMPYQHNATIHLINTSAIPVHIEGEINTEPFKWTNSSMYFHTTWKHETNIEDRKWDYDVTRSTLDSTAPIEWNFAALKGKGVYMGNSLSVFNHMHTWYGEGDAKIWVDRDVFPSEFGTGLEDYYNTSWAPVVLYQTPFANAPRADNTDSYGYNTFTRTRILDRVPFNEYLRFDMEMLAWETGKINADAVVYWYGLPGATDNSRRSLHDAAELLPE